MKTQDIISLAITFTALFLIIFGAITERVLPTSVGSGVLGIITGYFFSKPSVNIPLKRFFTRK
jgi:hypothetical protein